MERRKERRGEERDGLIDKWLSRRGPPYMTSTIFPHPLPECYALFVSKFGVFVDPNPPFPPLYGRHMWKPPRRKKRRSRGGGDVSEAANTIYQSGEIDRCRCVSIGRSALRGRHHDRCIYNTSEGNPLLNGLWRYQCKNTKRRPHQNVQWPYASK